MRTSAALEYEYYSKAGGAAPIPRRAGQVLAVIGEGVLRLSYRPRLASFSWWLLPVGLAAAVFAHSWLTPVVPADIEPPQPVSLRSPELAGLERAQREWRRRLVDERVTWDLLCLVRDEAEFFEAIGEWGGVCKFPILIDGEGGLARAFERAFRPARVVRYRATRAREVAGGDRWEAASGAWLRASYGARGPLESGATPGLVLADARGGALAGGVALAAGRGQALARLEVDKTANETLTLAEAGRFAHLVERVVAGRFGHYDELGDDCDFLTLAGDWPQRYWNMEGRGGREYAMDDLVGRRPSDGARYAFVGRLLGTPEEAVYRAMCSLFLQPRSALMFDGYTQASRPWSDYEMEGAAQRLRAVVADVEVRAGRDGASLAAWREVFGRGNRFDLVFVNTSGTPDRFNLPGGVGRWSDVPPTVPAAVYFVHSMSASRPGDAETIAGRWLANGAFLYFGSIDEPYLQAFRTPRLVADLLVSGVPIAAACARLPQEGPFGSPWRLWLLGDPLYRLEPGPAHRVAGEPPEAWEVVSER